MEDSSNDTGTATAIVSEAGKLINWQELEKRFSYRTEFIVKILRTAHTSLISCNESIRQACNDKDFEALAFSSHSVKGLSGNIIAKKVAELSAEIENKARASEATAFDLASKLTLMIDKLIDEVSERITE